MAALQHTVGDIEMLAIFALAYGFVAIFILSSLSRNRREELPDAPILTYAGHGLMAASATGACLALSAAAWVTIIH